MYAEYVNSYAVVYVDGKRAGEIRFPWGAVDITSVCRPGATHVLSMLVAAMPLKGVMLSYNDTNAAREVQGSVARRGLCGDVYLVHTPRGPRITDVKVETSVRKWEITFDSGLEGLTADRRYALRARITDDGHNVGQFTSKPFTASDLKDGRVAFSEKWKPEKLWDVHTPENTYDLDVALLDAGVEVLDASLPLRFGFREFWIDGRAPDIACVRDGLKVIMFEQTSEVLEKRIGFRVTEYGLRRVFQPVPPVVNKARRIS